MLEQQQAGAGATISAGWVGASAVSEPPGLYRPRRPERTQLYRVFEANFDEYLYAYEERFEPRSGPLRAVVQRSVEAFLACGRLDGGFARLKCASCAGEHLIAFSCQTRNLCSSCQAKRSALFAEKLVQERLEWVPHRHFVLTIPRAIRGLFERERKLLSLLSSSAYDAILLCFQELFGRQDVRPGCVASIQTFGSFANFHPHIHMLVTEGVFEPDGQFLPLPSLDTSAIEELFRRLLLSRLHRAERLSEGFLHKLMSWCPSGFSVFARQLVMPEERDRLERLCRYLTRPPVSVHAVSRDAQGKVVLRTPPDPTTGETTRRLDPIELIHALTTQIPSPGQHLTRRYGAYSNRAGVTRKQRQQDPGFGQQESGQQDAPWLKARRASWARLLRKILEVDPLVCPRCGGEMRIVSVITQRDVIDRILLHLEAAGGHDPFEARGPPEQTDSAASPSVH